MAATATRLPFSHAKVQIIYEDTSIIQNILYFCNYNKTYYRLFAFWDKDENSSMMRAFRALGVQVALEMKGIGKVAL